MGAQVSQPDSSAAVVQRGYNDYHGISTAAVADTETDAEEKGRGLFAHTKASESDDDGYLTQTEETARARTQPLVMSRKQRLRKRPDKYTRLIEALKSEAFRGQTVLAQMLQEFVEREQAKQLGRLDGVRRRFDYSRRIIEKQENQLELQLYQRYLPTLTDLPPPFTDEKMELLNTWWTLPAVPAYTCVLFIVMHSSNVVETHNGLLRQRTSQVPAGTTLTRYPFATETVLLSFNNAPMHFSAMLKHLISDAPVLDPTHQPYSQLTSIVQPVFDKVKAELARRSVNYLLTSLDDMSVKDGANILRYMTTLVPRPPNVYLSGELYPSKRYTAMKEDLEGPAEFRKFGVEMFTLTDGGHPGTSYKSLLSDEDMIRTVEQLGRDNDEVTFTDFWLTHRNPQTGNFAVTFTLEHLMDYLMHEHSMKNFIVIDMSCNHPEGADYSLTYDESIAMGRRIARTGLSGGGPV